MLYTARSWKITDGNLTPLDCGRFSDKASGQFLHDHLYLDKELWKDLVALKGNTMFSETTRLFREGAIALEKCEPPGRATHKEYYHA